MRYRLTIEYDGTNYAGWQRQKNAISVQEKIENALSVFCNIKITIVGSGRTDAGVHALGQVAHFDIPFNDTINVQRLLCSVNSLLPDDIKLKSCEMVSNDFHAQYSAKTKTYKYSIYISDKLKPLKIRYAERVKSSLDFDILRAALKLFLGIHDFRAFSAGQLKNKSTIREITNINFINENEDVFFEITGNGFLYKMVRFIVSYLIAAATGKITLLDVERMLTEGRRVINIKLLPANGLCLMNVKYPNLSK